MEKSSIQTQTSPDFLKDLGIEDNLFKTITESSDDLIAITKFGLKPTYVYVNPAHEKIGFKPEELIGKNGLDFIHSDDKKKLRPLLKKYIEKQIKNALNIKTKEIAERIEFRVKDKFGEWLYFESNAKLISGNRILFISRDVTNRKKIERELKQARTDWYGIFNALNQPAIIINKEQELLETNQQVIDSTGLSLEELKTKKCYEVFHPGNQGHPPDCCPMQKLLKSKKPEMCDMEVEALDGTYIISCTPILDDHNNISKVIHIATDITDRKEIENALKESQEKYKMVVETAHEMIFIIKNEKVQFVNAALAERLKVKPEELIGKNFLDFVAHEEKERIADLHRKRMQEGKQYMVYESKAEPRPGELIDVEVHSSIINYEGGPATLVMLHDITEKNKALKELSYHKENLEKLVSERTSELETKNRELEKFNQLFIGRELRVKELKDKIKELETKLKTK